MTSADHAFGTSRLIENGGNATRRGDPLPRLLDQIVQRMGEPSAIARATSRPWASALFQGRRHVVAVRIEGPDACQRRAAFITGIEDAEWMLNGHFVADITVDAMWQEDDGGELLELSALTIEDW